MTNHRFNIQPGYTSGLSQTSVSQEGNDFQFTVLNEIKDNDLMPTQNLIYSTQKLVCSYSRSSKLTRQMTLK